MVQRFYETFQKKLPVTVFEKELSNFIKDSIQQENPLTKIKGMQTACDETSVLLDLAKHYKASHVKWTGNHTLDHHFDGILYFNEATEQKIEISRILDEQREKDMKEKDKFSRTFVFENFDRKFNDQIFSDGTKAENIKLFIYDRLVSILSKKNKCKYEGYWLAIAYESIIMKMDKDYINKPIFKKIESNEDQLLFYIRKIFKKIIFVPNGMQFKIIQSSEPSEYKIFEWKYS